MAITYNSTPDGLLTYTSPSPKLCLQSSGSYSYQAHNLVLQSEDFTSASWTKSTVTADSATTVTDASAAANGQVNQAVTTVTGATYSVTWRVAKDSVASTTRIALLRATSSTSFDVVLDTSTGAFRNIPSFSFTTVTVTDAGTYWKVEGTFVAGATSTTIAVFPAIGTTADISTFVSGSYAAATQGSVTILATYVRRTPSPDIYLQTTTAARYYLPYEWNTSGTPLGIRVVPAATNLALRSTDVNNASWSKVEVTVTDNGAASAIGGNLTADIINATATLGQHRIDQVITTVASSVYTTSAIVASVGGGNAWLRGPGASVTFNLQTGAIAATLAGSGTIENIGGGRFLITATGTAASTSDTIRLNVNNASNSTGNYSGAGEALAVSYVGCELGSIATSPIETYGSTVTRAADTISLATSAFPYSATAGTICLVCTPASVTPSNARQLQLSDGTANDLIQIFQETTGQRAQIVAGGATQALFTNGASAANVSGRFSLAFEANNVNSAYNGTLGTLDTSATMPAAANILYIGRAPAVALFNGWIQSILYVPRRVSDVDLPTFGA